MSDLINNWQENGEIVRKISEWEIIKGIRIIDPDGFDRMDPNLYEKYFTEDEFDRAILTCTIEMKSGQDIKPFFVIGESEDK